MMQNWRDLYQELATKIETNINAIRWIDLWHNQINFLEEEHPFPTPAVFLGFRANDIDDSGTKAQRVNLQIDIYLYYETFADTFAGSHNQDSALDFLKSLDEINSLLHGSSGENYSSMRRVGFNPVDTGDAGNLYQITYQCLLTDYSATKLYDEGSFNGIELQEDYNRFKP